MCVTGEGYAATRRLGLQFWVARAVHTTHQHGALSHIFRRFLATRVRLAKKQHIALDWPRFWSKDVPRAGERQCD